MKRLYVSGLVITALAIVSSTMRANTANDYVMAMQYLHSQSIVGSLKATARDGHSQLPEVTKDPDQSHYYDKPDSMKQSAIESVSTQGTVGNTITTDTLSRPKIQINKQSPEIKSSEKIQNNAASITNGTYQDCNSRVISKGTYTNKTCTTSIPFSLQCTKTLHVSVKEAAVHRIKNIDLASHLSFYGFNRAHINTDVKNGVITGISMHVRDSANPWSCFINYPLSINGVRIGSYHGDCHHYLGDLDYRSSNLNIAFTSSDINLILYRGRLSGHITGALTIEYDETTKTPIESWESSCASIPSSCKIHATQCIEKGHTKYIDGTVVNEPCWKQRLDYQCGAPLSQACTVLRNQGCTQLTSHCAQSDSGICSLYNESWSCPISRQIGSGIQCGQQFYCLDGSCQATESDKNTEFGKSITELSAAASAAGDVKNQSGDQSRDPNSIRIFTGHAVRCREVVLGALNCCADKGWAKGLFLNCNDEEKALGHAKEQGGRVVKVGRYCSNKVLGVCVEHKEGYCIFPTRIAYDVQRDGRLQQLRRNFGSGKYPDCSGLLASEIQKIDFSRVDFSNAISRVVNKSNIPSNTSAFDRIKGHIHAQANAGQAYA